MTEDKFIATESTNLVRFEVMGRKADRDLIRAIAKCLADGGPEGKRLRAVMPQAWEVRSAKGGILADLLRSPLIGADLDLRRSGETGRGADL